MDVSEAVAKVVAEHDQEVTDRAAELERGVKETIGELRRSWVELARYLYEFWRIDGWAALGYESVAEWLADPEIELSKSTAYALKETYKEFVAYRGIHPDRLGRVEMTKVRLALPAVRRDQVKPDRALADAETLGWRDMKERYDHLPVGEQVDGRPIEPDDFIWEVCTGCDQCAGCGSTYKRRLS